MQYQIQQYSLIKIDHYIQIEIRMNSKKKIKQIEIKKTSTISRLIKCYICNLHLQSQTHFDIHLKQHQNKFNKSNIEQIQRKTQESFRSKKSIPSLNKTQIINTQNQQKIREESTKDQIQLEKEEGLEDKQQRLIEEALRQSQIILQKMQFMTQICSAEQKTVSKQLKEDETQEIQKNIPNQRILYQLISKAQNKASIQKLILETNFQNKIFELYQEQLIHLRLLSSASINPADICKIIQIRKNICRDVCQQLEHQGGQTKNKNQIKVHKKIPNPVRHQNQGQVRICIDCCSPIGISQEFYLLDCGHCYHFDCWSGQCCE